MIKRDRKVSVTLSGEPEPVHAFCCKQTKPCQLSLKIWDRYKFSIYAFNVLCRTSVCATALVLFYKITTGNESLTMCSTREKLMAVHLYSQLQNAWWLQQAQPNYFMHRSAPLLTCRRKGQYQGISRPNPTPVNGPISSPSMAWVVNP